MSEDWDRHFRLALWWLALAGICLVGVFAGLARAVFLAGVEPGAAVFLLVVVIPLLGASRVACSRANEHLDACDVIAEGRS